MLDLGFVRAPNGIYAHPNIAITVEFPRGPMAIGRDIIMTWSTVLPKRAFPDRGREVWAFFAAHGVAGRTPERQAVPAS
jgi:hypothetical protein